MLHKAESMKEVFYAFLGQSAPRSCDDAHRKSVSLTESRRGEYEWLQIDGSDLVIKNDYSFDPWFVLLNQLLKGQWFSFFVCTAVDQFP